MCPSLGISKITTLNKIIAKAADKNLPGVILVEKNRSSEFQSQYLTESNLGKPRGDKSNQSQLFNPLENS